MPIKRLALIGYVTFFLLLALSVLLYKERTVFLDISYHLFYILKDSSFAIQNYRFGACFTQLFPLLGGKCGLPLTTIAMLYSASFVLLQVLTFSLLLLMKNGKMALAYLLFTVIMTTHTFYWIQSELPQAMAFLFLFMSLLNKSLEQEYIPAGTAISCTLLLFVVSFTHPLMLFAFVFFMLFQALNQPDKIQKLVPFAVGYLVLYLIKAVFFKTQYDNQAMGALKRNSSALLHLFQVRSTQNYIRYFIRDYYSVSILLVILIVFYGRRKAWLKLALLAAAFAGYSLIVNIAYANGADQFYIENQYLLLGFMVAVPFAADVFPQTRNTNIQLAIVTLICAACIVRVYATHDFYTTRLNWNRQQITKAGNEHKKLILPASMAPKDIVLQTWGTSYEIWLLSTMEQHQSASVIVEERPGEFDWAIPNRKSFLTKWGVFDYATLTPKYFRFSDTSRYIKENN